MKLLLTTIAAALLATTSFADLIQDAAAKGDLAGVQAELDKGVYVNVFGSSIGEKKLSGTPLHLAATEGHKEVAALLVDNGADVKAKNNLGQTPLNLAFFLPDIASLLRKHKLPCLPPAPSLAYSRDKLANNVPFDFRFTAKAGMRYTVEATGDFLKWNKVKTIRGTGSEVKFTDTRKAIFEMQFYRVKLVN